MLNRLLVICLFAITLQIKAETFPWSDTLGDVARWQLNSSGRMSIQNDAAEQALRVEGDFSGVKDGGYWIYPVFRLPAGKSLAGARTLSFEIKVKQSGDIGFHDANVKFDGSSRSEDGWLAYTPPSDDSYHPVTVRLGDLKYDIAGIRLISIGLSPKSSKVVFYLRNFKIEGNIETNRQATAGDLRYAVNAAAPGTMFYETEPLEFSLAIPAAATYTVTNIYGKTMLTGSAQPGKLELPRLPRGYYFLELASPGIKFSNKRSFAVVPHRVELPPGKRSNYAIDAAQCDTAAPDPVNRAYPWMGYDVLNELCPRSGIYTARNRYGWQEPEPGKYVWGQRMVNAKALNRYRVSVTGMIANIPDWLPVVKSPAPARLESVRYLPPEDLRYVYRYAKNTARDFKGMMEYCEFWNEPDIDFSAVLPWDCAAIQKAAFLGFKAGDPNLKVLSSSFCNNVMAYPRLVLKNGGTEYFDIFNYHTYSTLQQYPGLIGNLKKLLAEFNIADRAIFFTETGTHSDGNAKLESCRAGVQAHDYDQEMLLAEFTPKSQLLMQSLGVSMDFSFVLGPYSEQEGFKDWGLTRRDYTAKPALAAFATLANSLAPADYLGSYDPTPGVRGFLFRQPDGSQTLALWRESELDTQSNGTVRYQHDPGTTITIRQPGGEYLLRDCFGTPTTLVARNGELIIPVSRLVCYVNGLRGMKPSHSAPPRGVIGANPGNFDRSIVFRMILGPEFSIPSTRLHAELKKPSGEITLQIYNFSEVEKQGTLNFSGAEVSPLPGGITIPAGGMVEEKLILTPRTQPGKYFRSFQVGGSFNGKPATPAVLPILRWTEESLRMFPLAGSGQAKNWRTNASGPMTIADDPAEGAVRFTTDLPDNRWAYPEYVLPLPRESLKKAAGIGFEIKVDPKTAQAGYNDAVIFLVREDKREGGRATVIPYPPPCDGNWHRVRIFFSDEEEVAPDAVRLLRIGFNQKVPHTEFKLRNIVGLY